MEISPKKAGFDAARLNRIDAHLLKNYIEPEKIAGCQVAIARGGHLAYFKSFGKMDRERDKPVRDDTIFRLYSMSKPIASVALMQLYEQGYFQLNDPVSRFFPEWKKQRVYVSGEGKDMVTEPARRPVSMRDMLSHTGGLTYGNLLAALGAPDTGHPVDKAYAELRIRRDKGETLEQFMDKLANVPLMYQPGERWMYSFSSDVLGGLVERISGKMFDRYLEEDLFAPLGMKDTAFWVPQEKIGRFAANYQRGPDKKLRLGDDPEKSTYLEKPAFFSGGGGLVGTTRDYLRFAEMLRRGGELDGARILGPRTVEMMHANHLKGGTKTMVEMAIDGFSETSNDGVGFGLGFASTAGPAQTGEMGEGDYYWGGAASTIFWVDPKEDMSVVFMTQLMPSGTFNFRGQLKSIIYSSIVD